MNKKNNSIIPFDNGIFEYHEDGLYIDRAKNPELVNWGKIKTILAYKRDLFTVDLVVAEIITNEIIGEWKLVREITFGVNDSGQWESSTTDYSSQNIVYTFQSNNTLQVSGDGNSGYPNGTYPYEFKNEYISNSPSPGENKVNVVYIQSLKYLFNRTNTQMVLDLSYVDGARLIFEKK